MKTHGLWEQPPKGYRAWPLGEDWVFLPFPVYWIVKGWNRVMILWYAKVDAPIYRWKNRTRTRIN